MDRLIEYFDNVETAFRKMKAITAGAVAACVLICTGALAVAGWMIMQSGSQVFVIDKGSAVMAARTQEDANRDLEAVDHVTRFHELMFNLSPNAESIRRNTDKALVMSDRSAYEYWADLSERGFYQRLVSANISQEIVVDSVRVDMQSYPYEAVTYGRLFMLRESNITAYQIETTCRLVDVERSPGNPHGMMIERFRVRRNESMGTRTRN